MTHLKRRPYVLCLALSVLCSLTAAPMAHADDAGHKAGEFASGTGNILFLAAGVGLPLLSDGKNGQSHAARVADSLGTSVLISEGLKLVFKEKRPDSTEHDSFPSGHATAAFAVATTESMLHPKQAPLWYLGATLISASRVTLHRHYIHDVIAGALIGYGTAAWETSRPHGLILTPFIRPDQKGQTVGVQVGKSF